MPQKKRGRPPVWPPNVYHHPSGRDRIRIRGEDYWLGATGSEEARREYARLVTELAESPQEQPATPPPRRGSMTLLQLVAAWKTDEEAAHSPNEQNHYRHALQVLLRGDRKRLKVGDFKVAELAQVRDDMIAQACKSTFATRAGEGGERVTWSRTHVNRQITRVRSLWRWAEERGLAPEGSWYHLRTLRALPSHNRRVRQTPKRLPATVEHLEQILPRIRSRAVRVMVRLQWLTGMRSGEIRQMRGREVDRSDPACWLYRPRTHKNAWRGQARVVPLGPEAQTLLVDLLAGREPDELLFVTRNGEPYSASAYGQSVQRAARKVGLPWLKPYCFRHGAKQRITREYGLDAARAILGQKHIGTTNDYGDAADLTLAREVAMKTC